MGNMDKVFERINRAIGQLVQQNERQIARRYAHALVEIRSLLAEMYEKYERGGTLTYAEMAKYDRLRRFQDEITRIMGLVSVDITQQVNAALGEIYQSGYYLTAWAVETETMTRLSYSAVSASAITAAVNNPISGLTWPARMKQNRNYAILRIQEQLTQGLVRGETYATMTKRLKEVLDVEATKATRIMRTEGHRVQESAKHDAAVHANNQGVIMVKEWNSLEDERVRRKSKANHKALNGKKIPVDENFKQGGASGPGPGQMGTAAQDINCRCFLTYTVVKIERKQYNELETTTFDKWRQEKVKI